MPKIFMSGPSRGKASIVCSGKVINTCFRVVNGPLVCVWSWDRFLTKILDSRHLVVECVSCRRTFWTFTDSLPMQRHGGPRDRIDSYWKLEWNSVKMFSIRLFLRGDNKSQLNTNHQQMEVCAHQLFYLFGTETPNIMRKSPRKQVFCHRSLIHNSRKCFHSPWDLE